MHPATSDAPAPAAACAHAVIDFNRQVLDQALSLIGELGTAGRHVTASFAGPVGAHLRHVIEHYDALLWPAQPGVVDYDRRPRDRVMETDPEVAASRLRALRQRLAICTALQLDAVVQVRGQCGLSGDQDFDVSSTFGRELVFVAGHAIHHYALIAALGCARGMVLPDDFGKAPATVAHERKHVGATNLSAPPEDKETSCPVLHQPA